MDYVFLNKRTVKSKEDLYRCFAEGFHFPEHFGTNLDALHDCLTEGNEKRIVVISDKKYLEETLGATYKGLCRVLGDAKKENSSLKIFGISL